MQVGPNADSAVRVRRAIRRLLKVQLRGADTLHQAHDPEIQEGGPGKVRVVWRMTDRVSTPLYLLEGAGFYEDRYVRTDDGWKIAGSVCIAARSTSNRSRSRCGRFCGCIGTVGFGVCPRARTARFARPCTSGLQRENAHHEVIADRL